MIGVLDVLVERTVTISCTSGLKLKILEQIMSLCHCAHAMVGPSVLDCDKADLAREAKRTLDAGADYLHLDVMDGTVTAPSPLFVPNLTVVYSWLRVQREPGPNRAALAEVGR